jgi:hypothetical protein
MWEYGLEGSATKLVSLCRGQIWVEMGRNLRKGDKEGGIGVHGQASSDMGNAWSARGKVEYEWKELGS